MEQTLFSGIVEKFFRLVIGKITEKFNGQKTEQTLLHKTMLVEEYSADLTWGATELNHSVVAADVVALDSSLPLKRRDKLSNASGKLPKLGMKYFKGEKAISDINVMIARGTDEATVASKVFDDAPKVIKGIDVRKEIMFLQALSTGQTLVTDEDNDGVGIRVSFGYKDENTFHAITAPWGEETATPQDDLQQLFDKAQEDGNTIAHIYLSKKYFNFFRKSKQGKLLAASYLNNTVTDINLISVPSRAVFLEALADEYGATFHIVDAAFKYQKQDGKTEAVRPWEEPNIIGVPSEVVGRLVYGTLAEETNPVAGVNYQKSGSHILVSKYSYTDPLREFTAGQALCLPVIDGADGIYILHADATDKVELVLNPDALAFTAKAATKKVDCHYDGDTDDLSVNTEADWLAASIAGDKISVKVAENKGVERSATVTVTDGTVSKTLNITQSAAE